ncbi:MAG: aldehyde dehydrogenase family protein [Bacteroidales bacterium]|nr:aldehyde dehydrogenase family protein [Bacteroidales bacterium]
MAYESRNPFSDELIGKFELISDSELALALEASNNTFRQWRLSNFRERTDLLRKFADLLLEEKELHAELISSEMGKPKKQALAEVVKSASACMYYVDRAELILEERHLESSDSKSKLIYSAQGTVFAIMPWNYPYWQLIRCLAPAVASGNCVVLKHASNVPRCAHMLEETFKRAGAPRGLFTNLFISHEQSAKLIENRFIRSISLTGSNYDGEIIAAKAGSCTKKCVLELGGSDPFIVFDDADAEKAAVAALTGRFQNSGQSCIASKRLFVQAGIYDLFMEYFVSGVKSLRCGDPMDKETDIGPLINKQAVRELRDQVERSVKAGARIVCGDLDSKYGEAFFDPMVLEDVPMDSALAVEETFGPVMPVFRFENYESMIDDVNSSIFGLGSSVWTNNPELISNVERDIDCGMLSINGFTRSDPMIPFGGVKSSGYGRELSDLGMMEFLNIKTVSRYS